MQEYKAGDKIEVETKDDSFTGTYIPQKDDKFLVIKLDNGYNIGIDKRKIKFAKLKEKHKQSKETLKKVKSNKKLPTISILHTGGTIASKVDYKTGAVTARFTPEELVSMFPEIKNIANINSRLIRNMWSEDMRFAHYNLMAKEVKKEIEKGVDGIIITHGTDTMHYTSAALSFILEDLPVPVILVGAQRSSDRGSSDAALNIISTIYFISQSSFSEVAVCMHKNIEDEDCIILPGTKCRKMHTSRRDAFRPINTEAFAVVNVKKKSIHFKKKKYARKEENKKLKLKLINEKVKVGILKIHTNMFSSQFDPYFSFDGLVLEATALGQLPTEEIDELTKENSNIKKVIKELCKKIVVVNASQCIYGRLQMNVYSKGRDIQELGVIGNYSDMTPETTFIKLAWLLSNYKKEEVKELITKNLRGEISERTEKETFLV